MGKINYRTRLADFPPGWNNESYIRTDNTILPGLRLSDEKDFGFYLRATELDEASVAADLLALFPQDFELEYRTVSEMSRGEPKRTKLWAVVDRTDLALRIVKGAAGKK